MPQALPVIGAAVGIASGIKSLSTPSAPKTPPPPPNLTPEQARAQAEEILNPLYGEHLKNALKLVDRANIRRGFFGQLPGAALARSTAADIETRKAQAIGQLTGQLQQMNAQQAAQHAQLALQSHRQNLMADQARLAGIGTMFNSLGALQQLWPQYWSQWFPGPDVGQGLASMSWLVSQGYGLPGTANPSTTYQLTPPIPSPGTYRLPRLW